jgi:hypothetical protein
VPGHLYSKNEERGIFKSMDGGKPGINIIYRSIKLGLLIRFTKKNFNIPFARLEKIEKAWDFRKWR